MSGSISTPPPAVSVIIISYNTQEMTLRCLATLPEALGALSAEVFVVDNASKDGSVVAIRQHFPSVILIENPLNAGFGAANNLAMQQARGRHLLLLNSDAFPHPGAIAALVDRLEENQEVAVVGPRLLNEDGTLQRSCYRFPSPLQSWMENLWLPVLFRSFERFDDYRYWPHDEVRAVDFAIGACLLIRRSVYEQVGGFDEQFFMYQEETDWQRRMQTAGWKVVFTPTAEVVHFGGGSGKSEVARVNRQFFESLDLYTLKHHGRIGVMLTRMSMLIGCSVRVALWGLMAIAPKERAKALSKMRKHAWLVSRQLLTKIPALRPA